MREINMKQTKSSTEKNEEYIQKLAPSLPKFEKVKNGVYKFRCVFCGDSKKNPNKRSGYFYLINNDQNYRCHKCNHRSSLKNVLRELKPELYMEYMNEERSKKEIFRDVNNQRRMDKIHKYVSNLTFFEEGKSYFSRMKEHSSRRFKEITKMLREEGKKRREKKEQRKEVIKYER